MHGRQRLKFVWTCSDHVHHEHRWKWTAKACGLVQRLFRDHSTAAQLRRWLHGWLHEGDEVRGDIQPLRLKHGDILVVRSKVSIPADRRLEMQRDLQRIVPDGVHVMILFGDCSLSVIEVTEPRRETDDN